MHSGIFQTEQAQAILAHVRDFYGSELEFLWEKSPTTAILRNSANRKWYAAMFVLPASTLGFPSSDPIEFIDLHFIPGEAQDFAASNAHILPGYHMNKRNWITIVLDGQLPTAQILDLLDQSYEISSRR